MEVYETAEQKLCINPRLLCKHDFLSHVVVKLEKIDLDSETREEKRRCDQARFARWLKVKDKQRLLGVQSNEEEKSRTRIKPEDIIISGSSFMRPEEETKVIMRLTDVTILSKAGGQGRETIVGTLEAHVDRFVYTASSFTMHFMFTDIKDSFFRLGDERMPPLVHFHFHHPIKVGKEETKDIEFHLAGHDSDNIEKEKQIRDGGRNEDLKNFVDKVGARWSSQLLSPRPFDKLMKEYEFYGDLPSKAPAAFALTLFNLIVLVETPFVVFPLKDIEIVNLALLRPGVIDMTVIFQDFEKDNVLQINSIPLKWLANIKDRLNCGMVKYYVNTAELDWKDTVKRIVDFPEKFIEDGGWDYFELEDCETLAYYKEIASAPDCDEKSLTT